MTLTCDNALLGLRRMLTTEHGTILVDILILCPDRWTVLPAVSHGHRLTSTDVLQTLRLKQVRLHLRPFLMLHLKSTVDYSPQPVLPQPDPIIPEPALDDDSDYEDAQSDVRK